jgi:glycogen synthase
MKILHITPNYAPAWHLGGVVRLVSGLCRELVRLGHDVTVFTTDSGKDRRMAVPLDQALEIDGVKVFYFKTDFFLKFAFSRSLGRPAVK